MLSVVIQAAYYFLPAYVANAAPVLLARFRILESLNLPVDLCHRYGGEPLFGKTKTYRGILGGIIGALIMVSLQALLHDALAKKDFLYLIPYSFPDILWLGFWMGLGEGLGDLIKSFFKRRLHIKSSAPFFPFDQMSFLGALALSLFYYVPSWQHIAVILILSPLVPVVANRVAYRLGWKKVPW